MDFDEDFIQDPIMATEFWGRCLIFKMLRGFAIGSIFKELEFECAEDYNMLCNACWYVESNEWLVTMWKWCLMSKAKLDEA